MSSAIVRGLVLACLLLAACDESEQVAKPAPMTLTREAIDAEEAQWLIGQLGKTENFSEGVRQLLAFIKANSPSIDPALEPLIDEAVA